MENFNGGWEFKLENDNEWTTVKIPHDWLIADTRNLYKDGVGCYRKKFLLNSTGRNFRPVETGEKFFLRFDGVYMDSTLYVNGEMAGEWKNGYTAFSHEITDFLRRGENEILLTVRYESPNTRWYSGAGIYRDCFLVRKGPAFFKQDGIYISTRREAGDEWILEIDAEVEGVGEYEVRHRVEDLGGKLFLEKKFSPEPPFKKTLIFEAPRIWDIADPFLYELKSELLVGGDVVDTACTRFGFREISFTRDGFFLNGWRVQLNGVCHHHDLGALGAAVHEDAIRRQLTILRGMGANAIRTAHNPPAAVFMRLCDEMGFLVMSEFSDMWRLPKTKFDYTRFFDEWAAQDVASWVRRDRNCPSLIMWSVGNEIYDTHADAEKGAETLRFLMEETRRHDPRENAKITLCSNYLPWENTQKCADLVKLVGYNYSEDLYAPHAEKFPDWIIYGSETASIVQSRGVYHFPLAKALLADDDLQCSALGNSATSWGAKSVEALIADHAATLGQFIWTGFDYIGEPTPYHTKNSYFGQIDTAGFPKDSYYAYAAAWHDWREKVILHLYPYWDFSPNQPIDVRIATNAPKTELFLNGKQIPLRGGVPRSGRVVPQSGAVLGTDFTVPYEPGELKAVAYDENDKIIATAVRKSFTDATSLVVKTERVGNLLFAEISAQDANGNPVENANNRVQVSLKNGELLGLDNGDSTDFDQYQNTNSRRLFNGKLLAIATGGEISAEFDPTDIPIRKIELSREENKITAKIFPENATHRELEWRVSDSAGIDSPLAKLIGSGNEKTLVPRGDGEIYIRAAAKNGRDHISLISALPVEITGCGKLLPDPYSFISGGLHNAGNNTVTNGNERGVATARDKESIVGFADLDFGAFGADEITLWLFPLSGEPFEFEIWRGDAHFYTARYDKGTIWNTYQAVTYKLPEKLRGIQTISFIFRQKVHIKGFQFTSKTYEEIPFAACDEIYGDSYEITPRAIEKIGNNVTIGFSGMDFTAPTEKIKLRWRSRLEKNTIRLKFAAEDAEFSDMLTLPASKNYTTAEFALKTPLQGKGQVSFIFLPGSEIDLEFLQFLR